MSRWGARGPISQSSRRLRAASFSEACVSCVPLMRCLKSSRWRAIFSILLPFLARRMACRSAWAVRRRSFCIVGLVRGRRASRWMVGSLFAPLLPRGGPIRTPISARQAPGRRGKYCRGRGIWQSSNWLAVDAVQCAMCDVGRLGGMGIFELGPFGGRQLQLGEPLFSAASGRSVPRPDATFQLLLKTT